MCAKPRSFPLTRKVATLLILIFAALPVVACRIGAPTQTSTPTPTSLPDPRPNYYNECERGKARTELADCVDTSNGYTMIVPIEWNQGVTADYRLAVCSRHDGRNNGQYPCVWDNGAAFIGPRFIVYLWEIR